MIQAQHLKLFILNTLVILGISTGCSGDSKNSSSESTSSNTDTSNEDDKNNDDSDDENDDTDSTHDNSGEVGTILLGTANLGAILTEANEELEANGDTPLDLDSGFIDSLPSGTIGVESDSSSLTLLESDSILKTYTWYLTRVEISEDGTNWVEVYNGDPRAFDLINGTSSSETISNTSIPPGSYKYLFMEIGEIEWQRADSACTELKSMGEQNLGGLLTTREEVKKYHQDRDIYDMIQQSTDKGTTWDEIADLQETSPKSFLEDNGFTASSGISYDDMYWYMHNPIEIKAGKSEPIVMTIAPEQDFSKGGRCNEGPGKPQFIIGAEDDIAKAVAFTGEKS